MVVSKVGSQPETKSTSSGLTLVRIVIRTASSGATPVLIIHPSPYLLLGFHFYSFHAEDTQQAGPLSGFLCWGNIMAQDRLDRGPGHRAQFEKNKKRIFATQSVCAICGKPVDFNLKYPHPLSPTIDHIIPLAKGGHPSDIDNLQLAHRCCNRQKSDKLVPTKASDTKQQVVSNRILPATYDWYSHPPKLIAK